MTTTDRMTSARVITTHNATTIMDPTSIQVHPKDKSLIITVHNFTYTYPATQWVRCTLRDSNESPTQIFLGTEEPVSK